MWIVECRCAIHIMPMLPFNSSVTTVTVVSWANAEIVEGSGIEAAPGKIVNYRFCAPAGPGATSVANLYSRVTPCSSGSDTKLWSAVIGVGFEVRGTKHRHKGGIRSIFNSLPPQQDI
jgi:hypothetical protein